MRGARGLLMAGAMLALCACWNGKDQFHHYMEEGRANGVPLIIYDISNNDARYLFPQPVVVAFVNTQDQEIKSVVLTVAKCSIKAGHEETGTLTLDGPFGADSSSVVQPISEPDADGKQHELELPHVVINAIEVVDGSGAHSYTGKEVGKLIDGRIANYCSTDI